MRRAVSSARDWLRETSRALFPCLASQGCRVASGPQTQSRSCPKEQERLIQGRGEPRLDGVPLAGALSRDLRDDAILVVDLPRTSPPTKCCAASPCRPGRANLFRQPDWQTERIFQRLKHAVALAVPPAAFVPVIAREIPANERHAARSLALTVHATTVHCRCPRRP